METRDRHAARNVWRVAALIHLESGTVPARIIHFRRGSGALLLKSWGVHSSTTGRNSDQHV